MVVEAVGKVETSVADSHINSAFSDHFDGMFMRTMARSVISEQREEGRQSRIRHTHLGEKKDLVSIRIQSHVYRVVQWAGCVKLSKQARDHNGRLPCTVMLKCVQEVVLVSSELFGRVTIGETTRFLVFGEDARGQDFCKPLPIEGTILSG